MVKHRRLAVGPVLLLGSAISVAVLGCNPPSDGEEQTTRTRSALTSTLFQPYVTYPTGSMAEAVAIGDLDSDGRNDVAVVTTFYFDAANDYMVHVFLQASDGTLKPRVKYSLGGKRSSSMDIGDVNGDGRADVVVGAGTEIGVLLQNASGTLDPMVSYPTNSAYRVKVGDFNGDGRMDVAGLSYGTSGDSLDVFLQTEAGVLAPPVTYHAPHGGRDDLDVGDINGDGRSDLVVMSGMSNFPNVSVMLQTPDGVMGTPTSYSLGPNLFTNGVAVGDTSGDGRSDIVVSYGGNRPSSFIARFLQNPEGAMDPAVSYASYDIPSAVVIADVDSDGRKDVLVSHNSWSRVGVYRQYPSGDFAGEELYPVQNHPGELAVGDINGDGRPDAVVADSQAGLIVLRHVEDVSLALSVTAPVGGSSYTGVPITIRWAAGDIVPLTSFDVSVSFNNGAYTPIPGCTGLPATARECVWPSPGPASSTVRVRVTAQDNTAHTASAESTFSLITPSITVSSPSSTVYVGTSTNISWFHNLPAGGTVRIELSRDGGSTFETLADSAPNTGSFSWDVTGPNVVNARARVTSNGSLPASGTSSNFVILTPTLTVTAPTAGATVFTPSLTVTWTSNLGSGALVRIELSRDGGSTFQTITNSAFNTGIFKGPVVGPDAADARVRVTTISPPATISSTSASFALAVPAVTLTSPAAGASFFVGAPLSIAWSTNLPASMGAYLQISRDGGSTYQSLASAPNTGSFAWVVTAPASATARIRVTFGAGETVWVEATTGTFGIVAPSLNVTGPTGIVYAGSPATITWTHNLPASDTVRVELSRDGGTTFTTLAAAAPNSGSFAWNVTGPDAVARVRVTSNSLPTATGTGANFYILTPATLTVTAPAAGAVVVGQDFTISWTMSSPMMTATSVRIELSRDDGATFMTLASSVYNGPTGGSFNAPVIPATPNARVRVTTNGSPIITATSASFSMPIPTLALTSPAAGTTLYAGTPLSIGWSTNLPATATFRVELSRNGGSTFETLAAAAPNTGSFAWVVSGPDAAAATIRVAYTGIPPLSSSSGQLAIVTPSLAVTGPTAGTLAYVGTPLAVSWSSSLPSTSTVRVELTRDGGSTFETLAAAAPNTGSFAWVVSGSDTAAASVRVTSNAFPTVSSSSGGLAIVTPGLAVTGPAAGIAAYVGTPLAISWSTNLPSTSPVRVELTRDGGSTFETLATAAPNTGSFAWVVTGPDTATASVRLTSTDFGLVSSSNGTFAIVAPSLVVTGPASGTVAYAGTPVTISWTHNLFTNDPVSIELSRNGGATFETLSAAAPNTGSFVWTASGPDTVEARVRVSATGAGSATGTGAAFQITTPTLTVAEPPAGASWTIGTMRTLSWSSNLPAGATVRVELSSDGGTSWTALATAAPATGTLSWNVTGPATAAAIVRVSANGDVPAAGSSGLFAISNPGLSVTSPATGTVWTIGVPQAITWSTSALPAATVKIQLSRNGGSTYTTLAASAPNTGSFDWTPTGSASTTAIVKISVNGSTMSGLSGTFSLAAASVTVTSPNTAVTWTIGTDHAVTWTHNVGPNAQFMIEVSRAGVWSVVTSATPGDATSGSYTWTVAGPKATNAKIRVTWTGNTAAKDTSDVAFKIN